MGRVYLAFTPAGRPVALKVLRPELGDDPEFRARFRQEVAAAQRVSGLFTAQVLDADPDGSPPWLVTAYVPGHSLSQAVATSGPLPERSVLLLMAGVAEALQAIHAAMLVHRDLKPSNVLLAADGPRVIDFGIARAVQAPGLTQTGFRMGTPQFMSPEQFQGGPVTPAADIFALGALTAYAATGRLPFGGGDEAVAMYRVVHAQPDLDGCRGPMLDLISRCLAKDPSARPAPGQVIERCQACLPGGTLEFSESWLPSAITAGLPAGAPPPALPPTVRAYPPTRRAEPTGMQADPSGPAAVGPQEYRRRRRSPVVLGAWIAAVALAGYGVATLAGYGRHGPSSPAADQCLLGTWTVPALNDPQVPGGRVTFSGSKPTEKFLAHGDLDFDYAGTIATIQVDGTTWTYVYTGSFTARYATRDGDLLVSDVSGQGSYTILLNGSQYGTKPLQAPWVAAPVSYTCSAGTLQVTAPGQPMQQLTRS
jgi:hypothetical protein